MPPRIYCATHTSGVDTVGQEALSGPKAHLQAGTATYSVKHRHQQARSANGRAGNSFCELQQYLHYAAVGWLLFQSRKLDSSDSVTRYMVASIFMVLDSLLLHMHLHYHGMQAAIKVAVAELHPP